MKKIVVIIALLFIAMPNYAKIGLNNFMVSVGGNFNTGHNGSRYESSTNGYYVDMPGYNHSGGGVSVEVGYLLSGVTTKKGIVNVLDIRGNFTASWRGGSILNDPIASIDLSSQTLGGGLTASYGVGFSINGTDQDASRFVFDIIGGGFSVNSFDTVKSLSYKVSAGSDKVKRFTYNTMAIEMILLGAYYMDKSGFMMGVRNTLQIYMDHNEDIPGVNFKSNVYVGYAFGK